MAQRDFFTYCTSLGPIELKAIGALSQVKHFAENDVIYSAGDGGGALFIINRGAVELVPDTRRPRGVTAVLSRGDIFGEIGALLDLPRYDSVRACAALSVQCFRRCDFPELIRRVPSFFLFLSEKLASRLFQAKELARSPNNSLELTGNLANFDVVTIYQTIIQSSQTGLLTIADDDDITISEFYFEKGTPRWGRFEHLTGEEAFWQLFLLEQLAGTFAFSNATRTGAGRDEGRAMDRQADEMLINAIQMRDQFEDLRKRVGDSSATLRRKQLNLSWDKPELEDLRPVAEQIWQLAYNRRLTLGEVYRECTFCDLKIYQAVDEMVRTGLFALGTRPQEGALVKG
jgi:CRP-like cAMP-binding protein